MNIFFRVDAYPEVGLGHFVRSLAIASEVKKNLQLETIFAGTFSKNSQISLRNSGVQFLGPEKDEDEQKFINRSIVATHSSLIFIDNIYPYTEKFILELKVSVRVVLFHNLCDGGFQADAFILPSAHHSDEIINNKRWKENKVAFYSGFKYIPINAAVKNLRNNRLSVGETKHICLTTGGSDPKAVMIKLLDWINKEKFKDVTFHALIGESFIKKKELNDLIPELSPNILINNFNYRDLVNSDLVISTFGVTSYELIYIGIPFISVSHAEKNAAGSKILSTRFPHIKDLGHIDKLRQDVFKNAIDDALANLQLKDSFLKMSRELMDDNGINRIIAVIQSLL